MATMMFLGEHEFFAPPKLRRSGLQRLPWKNQPGSGWEHAVLGADGKKFCTLLRATEEAPLFTEAWTAGNALRIGNREFKSGYFVVLLLNGKGSASGEAVHWLRHSMPSRFHIDLSNWDESKRLADELWRKHVQHDPETVLNIGTLFGAIVEPRADFRLTLNAGALALVAYLGPVRKKDHQVPLHIDHTPWMEPLDILEWVKDHPPDGGTFDEGQFLLSGGQKVDYGLVKLNKGAYLPDTALSGGMFSMLVDRGGLIEDQYQREYHSGSVILSGAQAELQSTLKADSYVVAVNCDPPADLEADDDEDDA